MALPLMTFRRSLLPSVATFVFLVLFIIIFRTSSRHQLGVSPPEPIFSKEFVVASLKEDDTSWLHEHFPDWKANIYVVNDKAAKLTVPINKGREAMVYLTYVALSFHLLCITCHFSMNNRYIIDNYDMLPNVMVFIHSLRYQWHNDDPIYG